MATGIIGGSSGTGSGSGSTYYATKFTSSGTFTLPSGYGVGNPLYVDAFLVGGGGGSAANLNATNNTWGGGGGGGGVRTDVLALTADAPIIVGVGGAYAPVTGATSGYGGNGGNGGYSAVNATTKNLFLNPQLVGGTSVSTGAMPWVGNAYSYGSAGAGAISGDLLNITLAGSVISQPYRVTTGATYTLSFYARAVTTAGVQSIVTASFYRSTTKATTANSTTQITTSAMATSSFTRYSLTFTVPTGSDMVIFTITGGQTVNANSNYSNFQLEVGSSATTYADGDTAGYAWVGSRDGSETVATGTYAAVAGGGGGGHGRLDSSLSTTSMLSGFPGATSGGGCSFPQTAASITAASGGHGGGAGGPATPAILMYATTGAWGWGPYSSPVPYGAGSAGFATTGTATLVASRGAPGPGIEGYGMGGFGGGMIPNGTSNPDARDAGVPPPNSGTGASGVLNAIPGTASGTLGGCGNTGADGVVILRYWA